MSKPTQFLLQQAIKEFHNGNYEQAKLLLKNTLHIQPNNSDALYVMGAIFGIQKMPLDAAFYLKKAVKIDPKNSFINFNLAKALSDCGNDKESIRYHDAATRILPFNSDAWLNYGKSLYQLKKYPEAIQKFSHAIQINSKYAEAFFNKGLALIEIQKLSEALDCFNTATTLKADFFEAWLHMGITLKQLGSLNQAIKAFDKAIQINPNHSETWLYKGTTLAEQEFFEEAIIQFDKAIELNSTCAEAWSNRGVALQNSLRIELANQSYRRAIEIDPNFNLAHSNLIFNLNYLASSSPEIILQEARLFGIKASEKAKPKFLKWNTPQISKKLRIGFVSGDFRNHSVGHFIEGLIKNLDLTKFELYAFATINKSDDLTDRIKPFFDEWLSINQTSDLEAANLIHSRGIQILIDLSGHTSHNRLPIFSYKPAPIQITWLGLPVTTGLPEIDYVLGDEIALPKEYENHFSEKIFRLPNCYLCLTPPEFDIKPGELPASQNGYITFGSFNNLSKINDVVIDTWSTLLNILPNSRLTLKTNALNDPHIKKQVLSKFSSKGIETNRLIFLNTVELRKMHLAEYQKIDIALDTFPYPGVTTSAEALWMGTPVINLKGSSFLGSTATSISVNAGLSDWVANDIDEYINKAIKYSSDLNYLVKLRKTLRDQVLSSPIFDSKQFSENFAEALCNIWNQKSKHLIK